jgi:general secretion pathway protein A
MYAPFFGLSKEPFSIAPDPRFLFMSDMHREALAHLLYGVSGGGGFVLLTGEIGAGKTTVCRAFLDQVPAHCQVAYIFNPKLTVLELLQTVCDEFGMPRPVPPHPGAQASVKDHVDALNEHLLLAYANGKHTVLIIDEAQSLAPEVLEQLRLLTNLETSERKLLQIVLIGQPELRDMLARPDMEQLAQRVIARYHLPALSASETGQYIQHRLAVAGPSARGPFDARAVARIHALTGGVPRRINLLCDRALLGAYAHGQHEVTRETVDKAAQEVFGPPRGPGAAGSRPAPRRGAEAGAGRGAWALAAAALAGAAVLAGAALLMSGVWRDVVPRLAKGPAIGASAPPAGARAVAAVAGASAAPASASPAAAPAVPGGTAGAAGALAAPAGSVAGAGSPVAAVALPGSAAMAGAGAAAPGAAAAVPPSSDAGTVLAFAQREEDAAWRELARLWQVALPAGEPCTQTAASGLACFRAGSGLSALRQLARPALLVLRDETGQAAYVQLLALGAGDALVGAGDRRWRLPLAALARIWRGEFATFWRVPPGWREGPDAGANAALRPWLEQRLAAAGADDAAAPLRQRVRSFQVANGLQADGLAGPMTLMLLGRADEPRLPPER